MRRIELKFEAGKVVMLYESVGVQRNQNPVLLAGLVLHHRQLNLVLEVVH